MGKYAKINGSTMVGENKYFSSFIDLIYGHLSSEQGDCALTAAKDMTS
jgi:hypothetical protein